MTRRAKMSAATAIAVAALLLIVRLQAQSPPTHYCSIKVDGGGSSIDDCPIGPWR